LCRALAEVEATARDTHPLTHEWSKLCARRPRRRQRRRSRAGTPRALALDTLDRPSAHTPGGRPSATRCGHRARSTPCVLHRRQGRPAAAAGARPSRSTSWRQRRRPLPRAAGVQCGPGSEIRASRQASPDLDDGEARARQGRVGAGPKRCGSFSSRPREPAGAVGCPPPTFPLVQRPAPLGRPLCVPRRPPAAASGKAAGGRQPRLAASQDVLKHHYFPQGTEFSTPGASLASAREPGPRRAGNGARCPRRVSGSSEMDRCA
jgi:hypothetical protein